jgi:hypothetical protein
MYGVTSSGSRFKCYWKGKTRKDVPRIRDGALGSCQLSASV